MYFESNVLLFHFIIALIGAVDGNVCTTPQYISFGGTDVVDCSFEEGFYGIYWYNSKESSQNEPIVAYEDFKKSGDGYTFGRYDVLLNGSLIIKNVSLNDDHFFRVIILNSPEDDPIINDIRVHVIVKSNQPHPFIDICDEKPFCFASIKTISKLMCRVTMTKPATELSWTVGEDFRVIPSATEVYSENMLFSSVNTLLVHDLDMNSTLELFKCTTVGFPDIISVKESKIFLEDTAKVHRYEQSTTHRIQIRSKLLLACSGRDKHFVVWKKKSLKEGWETIAIAYFMKDVYSTVYDEHSRLDRNGSLEFLDVGVEEEGSYMCVHRNSDGENLQVYDVTVWVPPNPPFAIVHGCQDGKRCVLNVGDEGNLTCSVLGVRPKVHLKWLPFPEDNSRYISIFGHKEVIILNGDTYDVSLTSSFKRKDGTQGRLAVECRVSELMNRMTSLDRTVELQFTNIETDEKSPSESSTWIVITLVTTCIFFAIVVVTVLCIFVWKKRAHREGFSITEPELSSYGHHNGHTLPTQSISGYQRIPSEEISPNIKTAYIGKATEMTNTEERNDLNEHSIECPMSIFEEMSPNSATDEKQIFEEQLQTVYREMYNVLKVQCLSHEKVCVNDFFIPRRFSHFISDRGKMKLSSEVKSHHDIFAEGFSKSSRLVLTGSSGSGKSTIALQMTYEWCERKDVRWTNKYDTLILLNVVDLNFDETFFQCVRHLFQVDFKITEEGIKRILHGYSRGLIIINGYSKLKIGKGKLIEDMDQIIEGSLLEQFHVVLMTTSQSVPRNIDLSASQFRLLNFEHTERKEYLRKVKELDNQIIEQVLNTVKKNPFLDELLNNPLVFVWYIYINTQYDSPFTSATAFIAEVIKFAQQNQAKNEQRASFFLSSDKELAKFAFDCLDSKTCEQSWCISTLVSEIGQEAFNRYTKTGILTTDGVLGTSSKTDTQTGKVQFCNNVLFEFYAAWHVRQASEPKEEGHPQKQSEKSVQEIVHKAVCSNSPRVICFMCGLHSMVSPQIIDNLCKDSKMKTLALQCLLEIEKNKAPTGIQTDVLKILSAKDEPTIFKKGDPKLHHVCTLLVEEIASHFQKGMTRLSLNDCLELDKCTGNFMPLLNGLQIPALQQLKRFYIKLPGQIVKTTQKIYQYSLQCPELSELVFDSCLLLESLPNDDTLKEFSRKYLTVEWNFSKLNLQMSPITGRWRLKMSPAYPGDKTIEENVEAFRKKYNIEEDLKAFVSSFHRDNKSQA